MEVHVLAVMKRNVTIYKHVSSQTDVTSVLLFPDANQKYQIRYGEKIFIMHIARPIHDGLF